MMDQEELAMRIKRSRDLVEYRPQLLNAEKRIMEGLKAMAEALRDIEKKELWRYAKDGEYSSLDDYCQKRWGFGARRRQQLQRSENVRMALADQVESPEAKQVVDSMKEGQVRALEVVPEGSRASVVEAVVKAGEKPTAANIFKAATEMGVVTRTPKPKLKHVCPKCGESF